MDVGQSNCQQDSLFLPYTAVSKQPVDLSLPLTAVLFDQLLCTRLCNIYVDETQEDNSLSRGHYVFYLFRILLFISSSLFLQWPCSNMIT